MYCIRPSFAFSCFLLAASISVSAVSAFGILGTDIIGSDISYTTTSTSLLCAEQCDKNSACVGWAWDSCSPTPSGCWMKQSTSGLVPNSCRTASPRVGNNVTDISGTDMPGMPLMIGPTTPSACADKCATTVGCVGWSFDSCGNSACWLKQSVSSSFPSSCRVSAVQETPTFPLPQQCTGICTGIQDTFLIKRKSDSLYFRFSSFDGIQTATSKALTGPWVDAGPAFPDQTSNDPIEHWTPDVHYVNGTYYMYYTLYNTSAQGGDRDRIQVATSTTLNSGSWTQHGEIGLPITFPLYSRLDSSLLLDDPQTPYLGFGSYAAGLFGIRMASSSSPLTTVGGYPQLIIASAPIPGPYPGPTGLNRTEGTFLFKNGGYYYWFYAVGNCCPSAGDPLGDIYHVEVCRGTAASGPYYSKDGLRCDTVQGGDGTLFLGSRQDRSVYSPGGVGILDDGTNGLIFYYQYLNASIGYPYPQLQWGYNKVNFQNGWPVLL